MKSLFYDNANTSVTSQFNKHTMSFRLQGEIWMISCINKMSQIRYQRKTDFTSQ